MPLDYYNPTVLQFLKESYDKENEQRISWFMKNKENNLANANSINNKKKYLTEDIARAYIEPLMPNLTTHNEVSWTNRLRKAPLDYPIILAPERKKIDSEDSEKAQEVYSGAIMKPVDPDVTKILKAQLPHGGRKPYLKKRYEVIPEEKYYFCETSSNIFGWHLKNSRTEYTIDCKRNPAFFQDLMSRSGPHPDPPLYNNIEKCSKCFS